MFKTISVFKNINMFKSTNIGMILVKKEESNQTNRVLIYSNQNKIEFKSNLKFITELYVRANYIYISSTIENRVEKIDFKGMLVELMNTQLWLVSETGLFSKTQVENKIFLSYTSEVSNQTWTLPFFTNRLFVAEDNLYCIHYSTNSYDSAAIKTIDIRSGKIFSTTNLIVDAYELSTSYKTFLFLNKNRIYFRDDNHNLFVFDLNLKSLQNQWQFSYKPSLYGAKIGSISNFHEELDLTTEEFTKNDLNPERKRVSGSETGFEANVNVIADGMGFMAKRNRDELQNPKDYTLYAMDMSTHKIVWSHDFEDIGMKNYRDLQYKNGKLYFLRGNGDLHIFEKET